MYIIILIITTIFGLVHFIFKPVKNNYSRQKQFISDGSLELKSTNDSNRENSIKYSKEVVNWIINLINALLKLSENNLIIQFVTPIHNKRYLLT